MMIIVRGIPRARLIENALALAREVEAGRLPKTERAQIVVQPRDAHLLGRLDRADVAGFGEHTCKRQVLVAVVFGIVKNLARAFERRRHVDR